jgi:hypothetical protein
MLRMLTVTIFAVATLLMGLHRATACDESAKRPNSLSLKALNPNCYWRGTTIAVTTMMITMTTMTMTMTIEVSEAARLV